MSQFGGILVGLGLRALTDKISEELRKREIQIYEEAWDKLFSPEISALLNMMTEQLTKDIGKAGLEWDVVKEASDGLRALQGIIGFGIGDYVAFETAFYALIDIVTQEYPDMAQALKDIYEKLYEKHLDLLAKEAMKTLKELKSS